MVYWNKDIGYKSSLYLDQGCESDARDQRARWREFILPGIQAALQWRGVGVTPILARPGSHRHSEISLKFHSLQPSWFEPVHQSSYHWATCKERYEELMWWCGDAVILYSMIWYYCVDVWVPTMEWWCFITINQASKSQESGIKLAWLKIWEET